MSARRNFLKSLFMTPAALSALQEREKRAQKDRQEAETNPVIILDPYGNPVSSSTLPKARCVTCEAVLISARCPQKKFCNFCKIYTHYAEDICDVCNNSSYISRYASGQAAPFSYTTYSNIGSFASHSGSFAKPEKM